MYSEYPKGYVYGAMVLVYRLQVPGSQVAGARQSGCRCRAFRLQVPGSQVAGAGQSGCRSGSPRGPGYVGLEVQVRQAHRSRVGRPRGPG